MQPASTTLIVAVGALCMPESVTRRPGGLLRPTILIYRREACGFAWDENKRLVSFNYQAGDRTMRYVVAAGNLAHGLTATVAAADRLALLVFGQLRFAAGDQR